jgi:aldose sugar dehydrogenase
MAKKIFTLAVIVLVVGGLLAMLLTNLIRNGTSPTDVPYTQPPPISNQEPQPDIAVVAEDLQSPWELVFLPDGRMLVTERVGNIILITTQPILRTDVIFLLEDGYQVGEGGLLGMALHPDFSTNRYVYIYYTYNSPQNEILNRVVRYTFEDDTLINGETIIENIPGARFHNGGRIKFGPDNYLYITTGDALTPALAQDITSLAGKILRVTDEGEPAPGNPFDNEIYSYGHRNPQGLAWDGQNRLWATEHGASALDELNLIQPGRNYGWPVIEGDQTRENMVAPVLHSGNNTWAPSGAGYYNGSIFFTGLRGVSLYQAVIGNGTATLITHFENIFGRLRTVAVGPDNALYILTNNTDGRGSPQTGDDKLIRINPDSL